MESSHPVARIKKWFHVYKKLDGNNVHEEGRNIGVIVYFDFCFTSILTLVRNIIHWLIYFYRSKLRKHCPKILLHN